MATRAYIGNTSYSCTEKDLREFFAGLAIVKVDIVKDRDSGEARGFCFIDFGSAGDLNNAIARSGEELGGRQLVISEARAKPTGGRRDNSKRGGRDRGRDDYSETWKK